MGIEQDASYQLDIPGWHMVAIESDRLSDIWKQEDLAERSVHSFISVQSYLDDWCDVNAKQDWQSSIGIHKIVWWFTDPMDAMMFKLVWA